MLKKIIFLILFVFIQNGISGIVIEEEYYSSNFGKKNKKKDIIIFQNNKVKTQTEVYQRKMISIINLDNDTIVFYSPLRKIYSKMNFAQYFNYFDKMRKNFEKKMKSLSPEEKKIMEKLISGEKKLQKIKIQKDKFFPVIAGFPTEHYKVFNGEELVAQFFISKQLKDMISQEIDYKKYITFSSRIDLKTRSVFNIYGKNKLSLKLSEIKSDLEKKGYLMKEIIKVFIPFFGETTDITEVLSVSILTIPEKEFNIPSHYKKVPFEIFQEKILDLEK